MDCSDETPNLYNPICVSEFVAKIRSMLDLPSRNIIKLNRALPFHQGVGRDKRPKICVHCKGTPETHRIAIRINAQIDTRKSFWYTAQSEDPFEAFYCCFCWHYFYLSGHFPSDQVLKKWDEVRVVYFPPAPTNIDRSICEYCRASCDQRRNKWCGPLQAILCDQCVKEQEPTIRALIVEERKRRGLPALNEQSCTNCGNVAPAGDRRLIDGVLYCKSCGIHYQMHGKMKPVGGEKRRNKPAVRRPKDKPKATMCENPNCDKTTGIRWLGKAGMDLCSSCHNKVRRGSLQLP